MKKLLTFCLSICASFCYFSQGDNCNQAVNLTSNISCTSTAGSTSTGFTSSGVGCTTGNPDDDAWYSFSAVSSTQTVTVTGAANFDAVLACYTTCAATANPTGGSCVDATASSGVETRILTGLTVGTTYFIKVHDYAAGGGDFTICVTGTPTLVNDDCAGAVVLNSNPTCTTTIGSSLTGATSSGVGCSTGNADDDLWYKFTAIASTQIVTVNGAANYDAVLACYTTCAASANPTGGGCVDNSGTDGNETRTLTGLTVGTTYFIKVHDYAAGGGDFTICVTGTPGPANDDCVNATAVTAGTPITGNTIGAVQDYVWNGQPCTNTGEIWYKFTTPATANCYSFAYDQIVNGCNTVSIWEAACPTGNYTDYQANFSTNNYNDQGSNESELGGMLPNTTYYISVSNDIDTDFSLLIRPNTPLSSNDVCSNANGISTTPILADNAVAGCEYSYVAGQDGGIQATDPNACDRTQDFPCSAATGYGPMALCALTLENISWYNFVASANGNITITFAGIECNNGGGGFQSGLFSGSNCASLTATGACVAAVSGSVNYTIPNAVAGASYYIAMDGNAGSNCHYMVSGTNIIALPIELGKFEAKPEQDLVKLTWNTYSERNNDHFVVEKSKDGIHYDLVEIVKGKINSNEEVSYEIVDVEPFEGLSYYRLSQVDVDGKVTISSFDEVNFSRKEKLNLSIYPNPSSSESDAFITLYNPKLGNVIVEIVEISGKIVDSKVIKTSQVETKLLLNHSFKSGIYLVKSTNQQGEIANFKWIVE